MTPPPGLLTYALDRSPSGIGQYTLRLLQAQQALGLSPWVLQSGGWPTGFSADGFQVAHLPGASLLPVLLTLGQLEIAYQARRHGLRLVHDPTGVMALALCPARRVVTICDAIPYVYPQASTALDRLVYRCWLPLAARGADAVLTISRHSKNDLEKYLKLPGSKITVTHLAAGNKFRLLSEAEIAPALERAGVVRPYILYVGSVEPRKNLLRLLDAYQEVLRWSERSAPRSAPRWRLVIVGARNYWKSSPVAEKMSQLGLQDQVTFTGYVPDEDLPALYNAASLFVFPSLYEGFGLPVLEAMACGAPVVTSNTSSLPEVAGDAALLVDPYDVQAIAAAMRRVLEDPALAEELRQKGLTRAKLFTWEKTARQTIAVYEKVLGEKLL